MYSWKRTAWKVAKRIVMVAVVGAVPLIPGALLCGEYTPLVVGLIAGVAKGVTNWTKNHKKKG